MAHAIPLKVKFPRSANLDEFLERYASDLCRDGIFIRTKQPLAVGAAAFICGSIGQTKSSDTIFAGSVGDGASKIKGTVGTLKIIGDIGYGGVFMDGVVAGKHGAITVTGAGSRVPTSRPRVTARSP